MTTLDTFAYFYPERPVLMDPTNPLIDRMSASKDYIAEKKFNGNRLQLHYIGGAFQFWNRHNKCLSFTPGEELSEALEALPLKGYCLFDGELRHNKCVGVRQKIMLYDVFIWNNKLLINEPFWARRSILESLCEVDGDPLGCPFQFASSFREVFADVTKDDEIEGLVMKNLHGKLNLSRSRGIDSRWMMKVRKPSGRYRF